MKLFGRDLSASRGLYQGTYRTRDPAETLADFGRHMPRLGITRLAKVSGLDRIGLPVYVSVRPNSRGLATSQGKGETEDAAKVSALMESVESWHGETVRGPLTFDSYEALQSDSNIADVWELPLRSDARLEVDRPMMWIHGWDLVEDELVYVPYELVSTNYVHPPGYVPTFLQSSNGLASGNHLLEAIFHGICEVIERDAETLWRLVPEHKRKERQVDLDTIDVSSIRRLLDTCYSVGMVVAVWDITSDVGVPTYTCQLIEDPESPYWRSVSAFSGHGCHLDRTIALSRAIFEAVQSRVTVISGSRDDMFPRDYEETISAEDHAGVVASYRDPAPTLAFRRGEHATTGGFEDDIRMLLTRLQNVRIGRVVVVDLTRGDIGVPVVKVVVPGLEPLYTPLYRPGKRAATARDGVQ